MEEIVVHTINITHARLIALSGLAEQAKPFYDWVERKSKAVTSSHKSLGEILLEASLDEIKRIISACYADTQPDKPFLFDGIGRMYPHAKACFYFWAWMIRDAPQQRLKPLIAKMRKAEGISAFIAEVDSLSALIYAYRGIVKSFEWAAMREIVIDRLEGSRRSISGHSQETILRTSLVTALQAYYAAHLHYGKYRDVTIADTQTRIGRHTVDLSVSMTHILSNQPRHLFIPVKSRETEGGGHSHIFTRDILTAIREIKLEYPDSHVAVVIIAENWSSDEMGSISGLVDTVFHFQQNPNTFLGVDDSAQIRLNRYIGDILNHD